MGFLESFEGLLQTGADIARDLGLIPGIPPPVGTIPGPLGPPLGAPVSTQAGVAGTIGKVAIGAATALELSELFNMGGNGNGNGNGKAGGVVIAGNAPGFYHTTDSGKRYPNRISFAQDDSGRSDFFVYAGNPTAWSKVTLKKSRPRHHHHRPR